MHNTGDKVVRRHNPFRAGTIRARYRHIYLVHWGRGHWSSDEENNLISLRSPLLKKLKKLEKKGESLDKERRLIYDRIASL